MMESAMVAMATADSFTCGSHPKSENMWLKAVISDLKAPQSLPSPLPEMSNPSPQEGPVQAVTTSLRPPSFQLSR